MIRHVVKFASRPRDIVLLEPQAAEPVPEVVPEVPAAPPVPTGEILSKIADGVQQIGVRSNEEVLSLAVPLARMIVERLVGTSAELTDDRLRCVLDDAINRPESPVGIYLNSQNVDFVSNHLKENPACQGVQLLVDNTVQLGECRVEFKDYDLVSNIESQLDEIEAHLAELINE